MSDSTEKEQSPQNIVIMIEDNISMNSDDTSLNRCTQLSLLFLCFALVVVLWFSLLYVVIN
jgi:hypothetical protein